MTTGRMLRCIVWFLSGLVAPMASVHAAHFAAAGVEYHPQPGTVVQCWFLSVAFRTSKDSEFKPVTPPQFECNVHHKDDARSLRMSATAKHLEPFTVETSATGDTITTGGTASIQVTFRSKRGVRHFNAHAPFTVVAVDVELPGAGVDTFAWRLVFDAKGLGRLLLAALGPALVTCGDNDCTVHFEGTVEKGEVEGHTAGGI